MHDREDQRDSDEIPRLQEQNHSKARQHMQHLTVLIVLTGSLAGCVAAGRGGGGAGA